MPFRLFQYPVPSPEDLPEVNAFLSTHRVVSTRHQIVPVEGAAWIVFIVEYLSGNSATKTGEKGTTRPPKVDYRDLLNAAQFECFSRLREWRKHAAAAEGMPVYALFTNAQLAEMVQNGANKKADLLAISGINEARVERYADALLELLVVPSP